MAQPTIPRFLEVAFCKDFIHTDVQGNRYEFYTFQAGRLKINSGKVVACDPFLYNNDQPYARIFPVGEFEIELAVAKIDMDERVGFSRIKFSEQTPLYWEMAVIEGQNPDELNGDEIFGYGVDAGTGSFMDSTGGSELMKFLLEKENNYEIIIEEMDKTYRDTWSWVLWTQNNCNVAMFSSGWGDGFYATYIGYDERNNICRLVTDFAIIE